MSSSVHNDTTEGPYVRTVRNLLVIGVWYGSGYTCDHITWSLPGCRNECVLKGISMTERHSDPLADRFDEAYVVEKTVDLVHGDDTYRIEIVRDLKHRGAGSRYK